MRSFRVTEEGTSSFEWGSIPFCCHGGMGDLMAWMIHCSEKTATDTPLGTSAVSILNDDEKWGAGYGTDG